MALMTYRASAEVNSAASAGAACNKPTGTVEGDTMFAAVYAYNNAVDQTALPTGWAIIDEINISNRYYSYWYKVAGASEPSTYTFSMTGAANKYLVAIATYYGNLDISDLIDAYNLAEDTTYDATIETPSVTVSADDSYLLAIPGMYYVSGTPVWTPDALVSEDVEFGTSSSDLYGSFNHAAIDAGATGVLGFAQSKGNQSSCGGITIALNRRVMRFIDLDILSDTVINVEFDMAPDETTLETPGNWTLTGSGAPSISTVTLTGTYTGQIVLASAMSPGFSGTLEATSLVDEDAFPINTSYDSLPVNYVVGGARPTVALFGF